MTARELDDVDLLLAQLKTLPLSDTADLDADFAAYDAFELLLGAVLRAALVQVPPAERYDNNGELFKRFVVERFSAGRGFGNTGLREQALEVPQRRRQEQTDGAVPRDPQRA